MSDKELPTPFSPCSSTWGKFVFFGNHDGLIVLVLFEYQYLAVINEWHRNDGGWHVTFFSISASSAAFLQIF